MEDVPAMENVIEIGVRWHPEGGHEFFGLQAVAARLKAGQSIVALEDERVLMVRLGEDAENVHAYYSGCSFKVRFAPRSLS